MILLIKNIKGLVQVRDRPIKWVAGKEMSILPAIENAFLIIKDDVIDSYGTMSEFNDSATFDLEIDATGRFVFPAFVDSHTHLVFAASREGEFVDKIKGLTYTEIAAKGGGILNSAKKLQSISEEELLERSLLRANEIMTLGTGAVEIKSGYGLTVKDELKMLRVAKSVGDQTPLTVKTTFLGAHAVPKEHTKTSYLNLIINEMIPAVANENLADYIDVFCEHGFFTPEETLEVVEAGKKYGMTPKIHANQLSLSGGVEAGVKAEAISVDHLECIGQDQINSMAGSEVMPTALPGAAFYLNSPYPPARNIIDSGLPMAIATDYNPGSSPTGNMSLMLSLACIKMKMTPEEAINAATINTAYAMGLSQTHGAIRLGAPANFFITKPMPSLAYLPYYFGSNLIDQIILAEFSP
ncbi:MAG: imidazolonepropionase [Bacteroidota bacterium]